MNFIMLKHVMCHCNRIGLCRKVLNMWQSFKEHVLATGRWGWVILVDILLGGAGAYLDISGTWGLLPRWVWVTMVVVGVLTGAFIAFRKVRPERDEAKNKVRGAISELESDVIKLGGQSITMAELFWKMGDHFLESILPGSIPGNIYEVVEGADKDECNEAWGNLKKRLRLLLLICDAERPHPYKGTGYTVITTTPLGASVLNELDKKWRDSR